MNKPEKVMVTITIVTILALGFGVTVAASGKKKDPAKDDGKKCPDGFRYAERAGFPGEGTCVSIEDPTRPVCPEGYKFVARAGRPDLGRCVKIDDPSVSFCPAGQRYDAASGTCVDDDDDKDVTDVTDEDDCPAGMVVNLARLRLLGEDMTDAERELELAKYPRCVPETCPPGHSRNEYGECVAIVVPPPPPKTDDDDIDVDDYIRDYPEDGAFYQHKQGEILGWGLGGKNLKAITQNMLGRALFLAAREYGGLDDAAALAWANARRKNQKLTNKLYNAIVCCAWNDWVYGTYGYCGQKAIDAGRCPASMRNHAGQHGRAIRPLTQHADNLSRMRQKLAPARTVSMGTPENAGDGRSNPVAAAQPGGNNTYPAYWLPGILRRNLWESDGKELEFDSDRAVPPDAIWNRGVEDYSGSQIPTYGCNVDGYLGRREVEA